MATSAHFERQHLVATDFDNTSALTFEASPNGMTVQSAYEAGIQELFGDGKLAIYTATGGLRNRAPAEIVADLAPELDETKQRERTEDLVHLKLSYLLREVGQRLPSGDTWPRVTPGFAGFWQAISREAHFSTAVVSSGHRAFISRFHEVHELPQPDFMVTDDDMRPLMAHMPAELCVKPSGLLLSMIHREWLHRHGQSDGRVLLESKSRMYYLGDDAIKDGQMAANYGVPFIQTLPADAPANWERVSAMLLPQHTEQSRRG